MLFWWKGGGDCIKLFFEVEPELYIFMFMFVVEVDLLHNVDVL